MKTLMNFVIHRIQLIEKLFFLEGDKNGRKYVSIY